MSSFLRLGKLSVAERPDGEVYYLASEVDASTEQMRGEAGRWISVSERLPTEAEFRDPTRSVIVLHVFDDGDMDIDSPCWLPEVWKPPYMRTPQYWTFLDLLPLPSTPSAGGG